MDCGFCESVSSNFMGTLLVDWVAKPLGRQLGYLCGFHENVENLRAKKEELAMARGRHRREVQMAENQLHAIEDDVCGLLSKVDGIVDDVESMEQEIQKNKRCLGWCPNWWWRYRLSKNLVKKESAISQLLKKMTNVGQAGRVSYPSASIISTIEFLSSKDFVVSKASKEASKKIFEALEDDNVSMIGLWGMGGSGKTTLVREVGNQAEKSNLFDKVVYATVSQKPNFHSIQDEIAKYLDGFDMNGERGRRSKQELWSRLQKEKKTLIILDDVWAEINLKEKIGIPHGEDHKGCKVLLTTRSLDVCRYMECQKNVLLGCLDDPEAWALFEKKAGLQISDNAIKEVAGKIVQKCEGLPIALVTLGSALKGNANRHRWEATYRRLKDRRLDDIQGIDQNAYRCLEVSFDYLKDTETKMCFLLCSLFPEDHEIYVEDLLRYIWGLELYKNVDSIEEVRSEVLAAVDILKNSSLLLDSGERHVKMHDIVRDFALWIASDRKEISISIKSEVVEAWREDENFEPYTAIFFKACQIHELPKGLICPNLKILVLLGVRRDPFETEVCHLHDRLILGKLTNLQTLHLERCRLVDISILGKLTNLGTLHLEWCKLFEISILGKLKKLQVLSFSGSDIEELPEELGDLNNLKLLDLSNCQRLRRIPSSLIQRLSKLEEVYLGGCESISWVTEDATPKERFASLAELNYLLNLTVLSLVIAPIHLPKDFVFKRLQRYDIRISNSNNNVLHRRYMRSRKGMRFFDYSTKRKSQSRPVKRSLRIEASKIDACKQLFRDLESLHLKNLEGRQNFVPSMELESDQRELNNKLTSLGLENCKSMKCLIDATEPHASTTAFCSLVNLSLQDLPELEEFCNGHQPQGFLQKLKTLQIANCIEMKSAIPIQQNLERMEIVSCDKIQVLFQTVELQSTQEALSQHVSLKSLKFVEIDGCSKLAYLFPATVADSLGQLKTLKIRNCFELKEIIQKSEMSNINLQSLREVYIDRCKNLKSLFSLSYGHILENLKKLTVHNCSRLEYTFPTSMAEGHFPQLDEIHLCNLPRLKGRDGNDIVLMLQSLRVLTVNGCPQLTPFIISAKIQELEFEGMTKTKDMGDMKMVAAELRGRAGNMEYLTITNFEDYLFDAATFNLSSLKKLQLRCLCELRVVWKGPIQVVNFQNLTELSVYDCRRLRYVFSPTTARNLPQLSFLDISHCDELQQIIENVETSSQLHPPICFPNLTSIHITCCENLKCLLPVSVAYGLPKLKELHVREVSELVKVFGKGDEANVFEDQEKLIIHLPQLERLYLEDLPKLKSFSSMAYHFVLPSLRELEVTSCPDISTRFSVDSKQCGHALTVKIPSTDENIEKESSTTQQTTWSIGRDIEYWRN